MLQSIDRPKIREVVAERLKSYIVAEKLRAGDRLPTEADLAARFGVSRLSLREATKSLEFLGILESKPGRGLTVGAVNMERVTEYLGFHPALQSVSPDELIDTRILIECGVLPHVIRRMKADPGIYDRLTAINNQLRETQDLQPFILLDIALHHGLIEASGLSPLLAFGDLLAVFFQRFRESVQRAEWEHGLASHQLILDSLRDGDLETASREVRAHIESHRGRFGGV